MLEGGPSHIDMWDLKPDAPAEIRGPFKPISTVVPGTQISQILPLCSKIVDKFTILRSHSHKDNAHQTGRHWVLTGYPPSFADGQAKGIPFNELYPSIGSIVSRELGPGGHVPRTSKSPMRWDRAAPGFMARNTHRSRSTTIPSSPTSRSATWICPMRSAATDSHGVSGCSPALTGWEPPGKRPDEPPR